MEDKQTKLVELMKAALSNELKKNYGYSDKEVEAYMKGYFDCDKYHQTVTVLQSAAQYEAVCESWESCDHYAICNGTKEREMCHCGGDVNKCDFYPKKRGEQK